ncbi:AraC family transcriptional regulator [Leptolyngbya cf. ectocarpi LEGE 11479]|uniref:AraC family transcriptional regulator n=1 Tax=Leptolyngbya cf. ectocarpi LEGE 11479 TaxID=1828722 RepID=A0A929F8J6_LEPEC|nr:helix-turn-helix domain-containing protein [Leptolyngbya ectocarpi]MBE9067372.1 AraC family transcriptional regulator [Leptolyngbya cf. ectocarpi LEGE 11479]
MRIVAIAPHHQLRPYVLSYRVVEDKQGEFAGTPIWTCPEPIGVLSANFGKCSYHESGEIHPKVGLLGVQTRTRKWISQPETLFVMAILTVPGMMTLFPDIGQESADHLLDVSGLWGERRAGDFWRCLPYELRLDDVKSAMDGWLLHLLNAVPVSVRKRRLQLHQALTSNQRIDTACEQLGITPRTLQREFQRHLGVSPKQVMNLHRLQRSVRATVSQRPMQEFADQSHEIRTWRRYLSRTPGRYCTETRSVLAKAFASSTQQVSLDPTIFYL